MNDLAKEYRVKLINSFEDFDEPQITEFICFNPEHVKIMVSAYHGFYSGDPIDTFINGEKAVTHLDWGLI